MRLLDKSTDKYDLWIDYEIGFGIHIEYTGGYLKGLQINCMGFGLYFTWGAIEDLYDK